jgi:hypothetical protein
VPTFTTLTAQLTAALARWKTETERLVRTWPIAFGSGAALIVVAAIAFIVWPTHRTSVVAPVVRHVAKKSAPKPHIAASNAPLLKPQPKPALPSAYEQEQQMTFSQMMARWAPLIVEASKRFNVPQPWIRAVMQVESGGRTMTSETQPIKSNMGAMGLMQLMPQTYNDMRRDNALGADPYDPHDNIMAGTAYLRILRDKYGFPAMFAAYNDGPGNLEARMRGEGLLPVETQEYMVHVTAALEGRSFGGKAMMVKFTRPSGDAAMINVAQIVSIRAAFPGEYAPGVQSVINVGRMSQGVKESVAQVRATIRAHGGGV